MDDDTLLFVLTGVTNKADKVAEESLLQLAQGCLDRDDWRLALARQPRSTAGVVQCALRMVEAKALKKRAFVAALLVLAVVLTDACADGRDPLVLPPTNSNVVPRVLQAACMCVERAKGDRVDDLCAKLFQNKIDGDLRDVALFLVRALTDPKYASAVLAREHISALPERLHAVGKYVEECAAARDVNRVGLGLEVLEHATFENASNALHVATFSAACLLDLLVTKRSLRDRTLRVLTNVTNNCPAAARILVQGGCLAHALNVLQSVLKQRFTLASLEANDFDVALLSLTLLANLVEFPETGGILALGQASVESPAPAPAGSGGTVMCNGTVYLAELFSSFLPARAREVLLSGDSSSVIDFEWDPEELIFSAHVCLILGCLVVDRAMCDVVRQKLPGGKARGFAPQIQVLQAFVEFQKALGVLTEPCSQSVDKIVGNYVAANDGAMLPPASLPMMPGNPAVKRVR